MAVLSTTMWKVHPGRGADFLKVAGEAKKFHEKMGARVFLIQWTNAGSGTGNIGYGMIFADIAAWGRCWDALTTDAEWIAWSSANLFTPDASAVLVSQSVATDHPGFEAPDPAAPGTFVLGTNSQLAPGRGAEEAYRLASAYKAIAVDLGASWVRFRRVGIGGEATLAFVVTTGFRSAADYGTWQMKFQADARAQAFLKETFGPGSPFTGTTQATGRVLPI